MSLRKVKYVLFCLCSMILSVFYYATPAFPFDLTGWDKLLKANTKWSEHAGIRYMGFDYNAIARSNEFHNLIAGLEAFSPDTLHGRDETIAFWINTYNIFAVNLVREDFPISSIKDVGAIFTPPWIVLAGKVGGKSYSLDDIEHTILRTMGEPGIHFALVCASISCPDLRREAYAAPMLKEQLNSQLREFLSPKIIQKANFGIYRQNIPVLNANGQP